MGWRLLRFTPGCSLQVDTLHPACQQGVGVVPFCCSALYCSPGVLYCARLCCSCRSTSQSELASTPQLLLLCSRLLESPRAFAVRYKPLMLRLLEPMQLNFNLLNPEQMAQVGSTRSEPTLLSLDFNIICHSFCTLHSGSH